MSSDRRRPCLNVIVLLAAIVVWIILIAAITYLIGI